VQALRPLSKKLRPGLLGLAHEDDVRQTLEIILFHRDPGTTNHDETAALLQLGEDLGHPEPLHAQPGHAHDVRPRTALPVDRLDHLIHQRDRMFRGRERGQQR
jgi:hypothetical protein